jgi:hypothetical protein
MNKVKPKDGLQSMTDDIIDAFLQKHIHSFTLPNVHKSDELAFKDHPQFPILVDIFSRKFNHHALLQSSFHSRLFAPFLESLLVHLNREQTPSHLRIEEFSLLDLENIQFTKPIQEQIDHYIAQTLTLLDATDKCILVAVRANTAQFMHSKQPQHHNLRRQFDSLLAHPKCRILVIAHVDEPSPQEFIDDQFSFLYLNAPSESDILALLKQHRTELERFHHVIIPEELLAHAYMLAGRYLSTEQALDKALLLLDSSCARAANVEHAEHVTQFKPVLTPAILANVLSGWTHIPATLLQPGKFKMNEFTQGMEQRIFGQDAALSIITHELQQAIVRSQSSTGPFCSFLFAGPEHAGKKSTAVALAEQMFKHLNTLYFAQLASTQAHSIAEIKLQRYQDRHRLPFKEVIQQTPYAMIVFENVEQASSAILDELYEILSTGYLYDNQKNPVNLHQAIIILSTTLGTHYLSELAKAMPQEDDKNNVDLLQLLMSDQQRGQQQKLQRSPYEISQDILPEITSSLPALLCKHVHIVPFMPLNKQASEHIIRLKLKSVGKQLETRYKIELGYAPEVIRFLTREAMASMDKAIKQLYFSIEQAVLSQLDNPARSNQLFLQLNETGRILKCDWLASTAMRHHTT